MRSAVVHNGGKTQMKGKNDSLPADLYANDQREPPGRFPALEQHFWRSKRNLLVALVRGCCKAVVEEYESELRKYPDMAHFIEVIAKDIEERLAAKAQG
jgi:hypothetical protein